MLERIRSDPSLLAEARAYYTTHPVEFITHWCETYNPRKQTQKWMPFVLFDKQRLFIEYLEALRAEGESGLVEKCRDIGATWIGAAYSVWALTFLENDATGWGSRKEALVDKLGDTDSIFEKIRLLISRLPREFRPVTKDAFLKVINTSNGASVTGEAGANIGRGGRKSRYFVDEAAHIERPETIEASLGDNTDVRIDMSSVNGTGNIFHRRRMEGVVWEPGASIPRGVTRVFIFDWRDHPEKTQEWYDARKAKAEREGLQHIFAQEVDRNYSAAVENTVISAEWIAAALDAHLHIPGLAAAEPGQWGAGLDVADEGGDRNALVQRQGVIIRAAEEWGERDPGETTRRMLAGLREGGRRGIAVQYDCVGVGAAVKAEYNRLLEAGSIGRDEFEMVPWNAGAAVIEPYAHVIPDDRESPTNRDFFHNFKAQAWWSVRTRFYKTWRCVNEGLYYPPDELISIDSSIPVVVRDKLMTELAQPTRKASAATLKMLVDKSPNGAKSPNLADALVQAMFPVPAGGATLSIGGYGG